MKHTHITHTRHTLDALRHTSHAHINTQINTHETYTHNTHTLHTLYALRHMVCAEGVRMVSTRGRPNPSAIFTASMWMYGDDVW